MAYGIIGPEFVLGAATGQYESASKAVEEFETLGYPAGPCGMPFSLIWAALCSIHERATPFQLTTNTSGGCDQQLS